MVARQAPSDVYEWLNMHALSLKARGYWLSLDYSDFNKEHRWWELAAVNLALFHAWKTYPDPRIREDKMKAALWTALSHHNRWAVLGTTVWRPLNGLFSGHRDTGRDNTLLHHIYQQIQLDLASICSDEFRKPVSTHMCGDDEDTLFCNETDATLYYAIGAAAGWHFNPRKQMISPNTHEFLQYLCHDETGPTQPLIPNVVAFVNGNWYKDPLSDPHGMGEAIVRVGIELINRGGAPKPVLQAVHWCASSWYKWTYGRFVRWDALLSDNLRRHPALKQWDAPGHPKKSSQVAPQLQATLRRLNPPGLQAAMRQWWPLLQHIPEGQRVGIIDTIRTDAFKAWFISAWNKNPPKPILPTGWVPQLQHQPTRHATLAETLIVAEHSAVPEQPLTLAKVAAITGIPTVLLQRLDLHMLNKLGTPQVAGYVGFVDEPQPNPALQAYRSDIIGAATWLK